jgi:hypothetical protein
MVIRGNKKAIATLIGTIFLLLISSSFAVYGQEGGLNDFPPENNITFTSEKQFAIPSSNSTVAFASGGSYANASLEGGVWDFSGLFVNGGLSVLPNTNGVNFSVSANNSEVTITHLDVLNMAPPAPGRLDYSVSGVGSQAFNLHYARLGLIDWTATIDGVVKAKGEGWTVTSDGWLTVTDAASTVSIQWEQAPTVAFPAAETFPIPDLNSTICFAYDGTSWGEPSLTDNTWIFQNLIVNETQTSGVMWSLGVSAQNCNVTVTGYNPGGLTGFTHVATWLNYTVSGVGSQTMNLNYGTINELQGVVVCVDGQNRTEGNGWTQNDGWITVTKATANVSIYIPPVSYDWLPTPGTVASYAAVPTTTPSATETPTTTTNDWNNRTSSIGFSPNSFGGPVILALVAVLCTVVAGVLIMVRRKIRGMPSQNKPN